MGKHKVMVTSCNKSNNCCNMFCVYSSGRIKYGSYAYSVVADIAKRGGQAKFGCVHTEDDPVTVTVRAEDATTGKCDTIW